MKQDNNCLFCKIAAGKIPCQKVYEDEQILGFNDIAPKAPVHILFIPKSHTRNFCEMGQSSPNELTALLQAIAKYAQQNSLDTSGFRLITNIGESGGQSVFHTHFHLLGGKKLPF